MLVVNNLGGVMDDIKKLRRHAGVNDDALPKASEHSNTAITDSENVTAESEFQPSTVALDTTHIQALIEKVESIQEENAQLHDTLKQTVQDKDAEIREYKAQIEALRASELEAMERATEIQNRLQRLLSRNGEEATYVPPKPANRFIPADMSVREDRAVGAAAEGQRILERNPFITYTESGATVIKFDDREFRRFLSNPDNLRAWKIDMERWGMRHGLFRAHNAASTVKTDIPGGFLTQLSAYMRMTHIPDFIFHQFPDLKIDFSKGNSDNIQIPRTGLPTRPAATNDRLLSGGGTYSAINAARRNVQTGVVTATLNEYGLGKNQDNPAYAIPEFVTAYSLIELENILRKYLVFDYQAWEDLTIRRLFDPTTALLYNKADEVATSASSLALGDNCTMTEDFLYSVYGYMRSLQTPTYEDGCYMIVMNPRALTQFQRSLSDRFDFPSPSAVADLTNMLAKATANDSLTRVDGYHGKYCGFHVFSTNAFGVGAAAANPADNPEGVNTETIASASRTTRTSYAFGPYSIGRGVGMPMTIRRAVEDGFGRSNDYIWLSHESFVALDVDPVGYNDTSAVPQQLRVFDIRTTDVPIPNS